eukprot:TRINITY_DN2194_c0_g1_i1.p1 TRINITY_DN2194_c0_g1~~TRINITY_DN2194_c0_g1_i1.p1  ORF type:complete len:109 (+),score=18.62 TRINITY_DN2194_c0_g1_i1:25-351(+)
MERDPQKIKGRYTYGEQEMMEEGIDRGLSKLSSNTRLLIDNALGIKESIARGNSELDRLNSGMSEMQGLFAGSLTRLQNMTKTATTKQMGYVVLFIVFVFLIVYYFLF